MLGSVEVSSRLTSALGFEPIAGETLHAAATRIRASLVKAITQVHPGSSWDIEDGRVKKCCEFLSPFGSIFTLNYDLLTYWALLHGTDVSTTRLVDGFVPRRPGALTFDPSFPGGSRRLYFLHCGLHLIQSGADTLKLKYRDSQRVLPQVIERITAGELPIFIAEGTSEQKQNRIGTNGYLSTCFEKLRNLSVSLYTFGWSLSDIDDHILDAIASNTTIRRLVVGVRNESGMRRAQGKLLSFDFVSRRRIAIESSRVRNKPNLPDELSDVVGFWNSGMVNPWA